MLLRPATPLTIVLLAAFALLLISVISTPIVKSIPLASYGTVNYGVFGYCAKSQCTDPHVGYSTNDLSSTDGSNDFDLPLRTRKSLASILIVHPIAAFFTLVCLCMAAAAHFHAPSHSPRYLLALLFLLLPTLLVSLLAFLVDILLFVPHLQWGGWIVLAATVLIVTCGVLTCAMRRTLVSRKARKRDIAENAEMSGENFYNRQNAAAATLASKPGVATDVKENYITESSTTGSFRTPTRGSDDDRTPLNAVGTHPNDVPDMPPFPDGHVSPAGSISGRLYNGSRDPTDTFFPPAGAYGAVAGMRHPDQRSRPQRGMPPGPGPRGRGGYAPRGAYPPRGGYGRGGAYRGGPRGAPPIGTGPMGRGQQMRPPAAPGYPISIPEQANEFRGPSPVCPRSRSPVSPIRPGLQPDDGPIGQAIEMTPQTRNQRASRVMPTDDYMRSTSPSSMYSGSEVYVPPRDNWALGNPGKTTPTPPIPEYAPMPMNLALPHHGRPRPVTSYYEDMDPLSPEAHGPETDNLVPSALVPGYSVTRTPSPRVARTPSPR